MTLQVCAQNINMNDQMKWENNRKYMEFMKRKTLSSQMYLLPTFGWNLLSVPRDGIELLVLWERIQDTGYSS